MADRTPDGRYIVIDGRRWRASDPELDDGVRRALVSELMSARRAVRRAQESDDGAGLRAARSRVNDAKVALGERGRPWWEPQTAHDRDLRRAATERALERRPADASDCPGAIGPTSG